MEQKIPFEKPKKDNMFQMRKQQPEFFDMFEIKQ